MGEGYLSFSSTFPCILSIRWIISLDSVRVLFILDSTSPLLIKLLTCPVHHLFVFHPLVLVSFVGINPAFFHAAQLLIELRLFHLCFYFIVGSLSGVHFDGGQAFIVGDLFLIHFGDGRS